MDEKRVGSAPQNGIGLGELHKPRGLREMEYFRGEDGKPPVSIYTLGSLIRTNKIGKDGKWTIAEWIDGVLSGRLAFPERLYLDDIRRATIEAARRFPGPPAEPDEEINAYLLQRLSHYAALDVASKSLPAKSISQIQTAVLAEPLYLTPERISEITGLSVLEVREIELSGAKPLEDGAHPRALNLADVIRFLLGLHPEKALNLYNYYISRIMNHKS